MLGELKDSEILGKILDRLPGKLQQRFAELTFLSRGKIVTALSLVCFMSLRMLLNMPNLNGLKSLFVIDPKSRKGVKDIVRMQVLMMTGLNELNLLL